jgi:hypothetical protein
VTKLQRLPKYRLDAMRQRRVHVSPGSLMTAYQTSTMSGSTLVLPFRRTSGCAPNEFVDESWKKRLACYSVGAIR